MNCARAALDATTMGDDDDGDADDDDDEGMNDARVVTHEPFGGTG